jgi:hypothetical protein
VAILSYIFRTSTYSTISKNYSEIKDKWDNKEKDFKLPLGKM